MGKQFTTGNSTVAGLKVGTELVVVAPGTLEVVGGGAPAPGDRISTKYGEATVLAPSSRIGDIEGFDPETQVLYLADGTSKVRIFTF